MSNPNFSWENFFQRPISGWKLALTSTLFAFIGLMMFFSKQADSLLLRSFELDSNKVELYLVSHQGQVQAGLRQMQDITTGRRVKSGSQIITQANSQAVLRFTTGDMILIGPDSHVHLQIPLKSDLYSQNIGQIELIKGTILRLPSFQQNNLIINYQDYQIHLGSSPGYFSNTSSRSLLKQFVLGQTIKYSKNDELLWPPLEIYLFNPEASIAKKGQYKHDNSTPIPSSLPSQITKKPTEEKVGWKEISQSINQPSIQAQKFLLMSKAYQDWLALQPDQTSGQILNFWQEPFWVWVVKNNQNIHAYFDKWSIKNYEPKVLSPATETLPDHSPSLQSTQETVEMAIRQPPEITPPTTHSQPEDSLITPAATAEPQEVDFVGNGSCWNFTYELLQELNSLRLSRGLSALICSPNASRLAQHHSAQMAQAQQLLNHQNLNTRLQQFQAAAPAVSELEGKLSLSNEAANILATWMALPDFNHDLFDSKFTHAGAQVVQSESGQYYFTLLLQGP